MIIDDHVHLWKLQRTERPDIGRGGLEVLLNEYMNKRGVDKAVILGLQEPAAVHPWSDEYSISEVLELSKKHGGRFIPFCGVDWRWDSEKVDKVRRYVEMGCRGCGELDHSLVVDDSRLLPVYKVCGELGIPVLLHMESAVYNVNLDGFMRVLGDFPNTNFIAHGPAWWRHISGEPYPKTVKRYPPMKDVYVLSLGYPADGYPWEPVQPGGKVEQILKIYPNVYADLSAPSGLMALQRDYAYAREFLEEFKDRILYGTDFPARNLWNKEVFGVDGLHLNFLKALGLSEDTYEKITHENIEKLLKL